MNNEKIRRFTDLNTWKEAHKLALMIYKLTEKFPPEEKYSLTSQIRRAAISVTSNISEGFSRNHLNEKIQFYGIAQGSNTELENQLILSRDLGYIQESQFTDIFEQSITVHKLINGLIKGARKLSINT